MQATSPNELSAEVWGNMSRLKPHEVREAMSYVGGIDKWRLIAERRAKARERYARKKAGGGNTTLRIFATFLAGLWK